jgi:hypothetical protein
MDARRIGRFKAVSVSRTKVPLAADGTHGMDVHPCTQFKVVSVNPIRGRSMVPADGAITAKQSLTRKSRARMVGARSLTDGLMNEEE